MNASHEVDALDLNRVVQQLAAIKGRIGRSLLDLRKTGVDRAAAIREYEIATARVRVKTDGTVQAKQDAALLDEHCMTLRAAMDIAKESEKYQKSFAAALESDQSNLQTQAKLIDTAMKLAGVRA